MKRILCVLLVLGMLTACSDQLGTTVMVISSSNPESSLSPSSSQEMTSSSASSQKEEDNASSQKEIPETSSSSTVQAPTPSSSNVSSVVADPSATPVIVPIVRETAPNPAKKNWPLAYETFYSGFQGEAPEKLVFETEVPVQIRENLIYPIYRMRTEELTPLEQEGKLPADGTNQYGVILEEEDGMYYGEGEIRLYTVSEDAPVVDVTQFPVGSYMGRSSMTITEGVEQQLEKSGFLPETTKAYAIEMNTIGIQGVLFMQGNDSLFYLQSLTSNGEKMGFETGMILDLCSIRDQYERYGKEIAPTKPTEEQIRQNPMTGKPVIYLYPEKETAVQVKVDYQGEFSYTYPTYNNGWSVTASPDGKLINHSDQSEHYYLFWEGNKAWNWDFSHGFVVKGSDTETFLREKLAYMGLTPREYNDFITYWAPEMIQNDYNLITFAEEEYEALAPLTVSPTPDSTLRVHMVYQACAGDQKVLPQTLKPFERKGFTVVEWGGTRA